MTPTKTPTRGSAALCHRLQSITQVELSELTTIPQNTLSSYATGTSRPEALPRELLRIATGIPRRWWFTGEELERIARVTEHVSDLTSVAAPRKVRARAVSPAQRHGE